MGSPNGSTDASHRLDVRRVGRIAYAEGHRLQERLVAERIAGSIPDTLVLCEHDAVITLGRKSSDEDVDDLEGLAIPVVEVERGGEATFHGPGQLVVYPIVLLEPARRDLHRYLRDLEEVVIRALAAEGLRGERKDGYTGVWIGARKICSIGVAVRRWVAWHGLALNVDTDLAAFRGFRPCGLDPEVMTSVRAELGRPASMGRFEALVAREFASVFERELATRRD